MRAFYEACEVAMDSKRSDSAVKRLRDAHDIMQPLVNLARARLELRLVYDLWEHLRWCAAWVIYTMDNRKGKYPPIMPFLSCYPGTTYVYPPAPRNRGSLDYRWSAWKDLPETMLPQVPMRASWPIVRDKTVYEIAR